MENATKSTRDKLLKLVSIPAVVNNKHAAVRAAAKIGHLAVEGKVEHFFDALAELRDIDQDGRPGTIAGILNEVRHPAELFKRLLLVSKRNQQLREDVQMTTAQVLQQAFLKPVSRAASKALSSVLLRTGAHHLMGTYSMRELQKMLSDETVLQKNIKATQSQITGNYAGFMIQQAKALGHFIATGRNNNDLLMLNAHNIVSMYGTGVAHGMTQTQFDKNVAAVTQLVSLYGIQYAKDKQAVIDLLEQENARGENENGVAFTLHMHKSLEQKSLDSLFRGNPALMQHGYMPEIYNPHTELVMGDSSSHQDLIDQGYVLVTPLTQDPADPTQVVGKALYVLKDGGLEPWNSGIVSLTGERSKGSKLSYDAGGSTRWKTQVASTKAMKVLSKRKINVNVSLQEAERYNPKVGDARMVPLMNEQGLVTDWRYMMSESMKDSVLERTNDFDKLLGSLNSSIFDKVTAKEHNKSVVEALYEDFKENYKFNNRKYMEVSENSSDPEMQELWRILPEDLKFQIRKTFGTNGITVRKEAMDIIFGYRKASLSNPFRKVAAERQERKNQGQRIDIDSLTSVQGLEMVFVKLVEGALRMRYMSQGFSYNRATAKAAKAAVMISKAERVWQELVKEVKDIIVVKSIAVMLGNIKSNFSILALDGIPLLNIVKYHNEAFQGVMQYRTDSIELDQLLVMKEVGQVPSHIKDIDSEIALLQDAVNRNPIKKLIDAGLNPAIVEDIDTKKDPYSYKSLLQRKTEDKVSKLPKVVANAAKMVYMTHDTKLYKALSEINRWSDFVARYTVYQHSVSKTKNPLTHEQAIMKANDMFVSYDAALPKKIQYLDDMGIMPFTKYALRIQKVIGRLFADNPAKVLLAAGASDLMDFNNTILQSSWV